MTKRADFSKELAAVKSTAEQEVASLLRLVDQSRATTSGNSSSIQPKVEVRHHLRQRENESRQSEVPVRRQTDRERSDGTILENVTTRLTRETNELLTEAALRQKLAKRLPDTRQEIIEIAVNEWFIKNGYGVRVE